MPKRKRSSTRTYAPGLSAKQKRQVDEAMDVLARGGEPKPVFLTKKWGDKMRSSEPGLGAPHQVDHP